jgi:hypothetical protein
MAGRGDGEVKAGTAVPNGLAEGACDAGSVVNYLREVVPLLLGGTEAQLYDALIKAEELATQCVVIGAGDGRFFFTSSFSFSLYRSSFSPSPHPPPLCS